MSNKKNKNNPFNKIILILMLLSSLFSGYLHTSIPVFFFALIILGIYLFQIKFTVSQILVICIFFIYLIVILINSTEVLSSLSNLKWFYGMLIFPTFFYLISNSLNQKLSIDYYKNTIEYKFSLINRNEIFNNLDPLNYNFENILGYTVSSDVPLNAGDFGWLNLFYSQGILGFIVFFLIIFVFSNGLKKNRLAIIILFFGSFHYSAIFLAAGQILLSKSIMNDK